MPCIIVSVSLITQVFTEVVSTFSGFDSLSISINYLLGFQRHSSYVSSLKCHCHLHFGFPGTCLGFGVGFLFFLINVTASFKVVALAQSQCGSRARNAVLLPASVLPCHGEGHQAPSSTISLSRRLQLIPATKFMLLSKPILKPCCIFKR